MRLDAPEVLAVAADRETDVAEITAVDAGVVGRVPAILIRHDVHALVRAQHQEVDLVLQAVVGRDDRVVRTRDQVLDVGAEAHALGPHLGRAGLARRVLDLPGDLDTPLRIRVLVVAQQGHDVVEDQIRQAVG